MSKLATRPRALKNTRAGSNRPWVVLSAFPPEIAWLKAYCRANAVLQSEVILGSSGIGLVDAAAGASRLLAGLAPDLRPRGVIFIGTAGAATLRGQPGIGQAVVPDELVLFSHGVADGRAYVPEIMVTRQDAAARLVVRFQQAGALPAPAALCPIGITKKRAPAYPRPFVENLEAFAVARAAATYKLPFAAVLGISNTIGPNAHGQWKANAKPASEAACQVVARGLFRAPSR